MATPERTVETSVSTVTPSGIEVFYQWAPKRLYQVRQHIELRAMPDEGWTEVGSVTNVLKVLDSPALPWWGMGVGIEGTIAMFNMGMLGSTHALDSATLQQLLTVKGAGEMGADIVAGKDEIIELLSKHGLTVNQVRDTAGDRGTSVHDALEVWATTGDLPDPEMFPPHEQGYVLGLIEFINDTKFIPEAQEVMVGSIEHEYAGRYDLRGSIPEECNVVVHRTPKRGEQRKLWPASTNLVDLKTSKGVYDKHALQLEGYEGASVECGYPATDKRAILHVGPNGTYELVESWATFEDWLTVLATYKALEAMKERKKRK